VAGLSGVPQEIEPVERKSVDEVPSSSLDWRRAILITHRWLGIVGGLLFVAWFGSGIVMLYARMPHLPAGERLRRLPDLDLRAARVAPSEAAYRLDFIPERLRIGMLGNRPVYRFATGTSWATVFADRGERFEGLTRGFALEVARLAYPEHAATMSYSTALSEPDQWTLQSRAFMPLHRVDLGDSRDTHLYLSDRTGEVVMKTDRPARRLAYPGAVLHWLYFTPFRRHGDLWLWSVIGVSIAGCVLSLSGLIWGVWRYSPRARFPDRKRRGRGTGLRSPYGGAMRWHHYGGLIFGLFTFTWALSGCLSLDPWNWHPGNTPSRLQQRAVAGGPPSWEHLLADDLRQAADDVAASFTPKELELLQFRGDTFLSAYRPPATGTRESPRASPSSFLSSVQAFEHRLVATDPQATGRAIDGFAEDELLAAARDAMPAVGIAETTWLDRYDSYYYDRDHERPLPVLRVRFDDPAETWLYLDPKRGRILQKEEKLSRLNRWLYHGLHSLDFPFLYDRRPLWDIIVIALSIGGLLVAVTSMAQGWRRIRRHTGRLAAFLRSPRSPL
jgi:hypothetical protein